MPRIEPSLIPVVTDLDPSEPAACLAAHGDAMDVVTATKRYVADDRYRVRLFDTCAGEVHRVVEVLKGSEFSMAASWSQESFRGG